MRPVRTVVTATLIASTLAAGSFLAGVRHGERGSTEGFGAVVETARELQHRAAEPVSEEELARAAIKGMLEALDDPYATLLNPRESREVRRLLGGSMVGIGIWLEEEPRGLRITSVVAGTPAEKSGLRPGDVIVQVDGEPVRGRSVDEVSKLISGPEGSETVLSVARGDRTLSITVERARFEVSDVQARMLRAKIAYARVVRFGRGSADELEGSLRDLLQQGAHGVVLDLRDNAGGLAGEAVDVAGLFLGDAVVARVRERGRGEKELRVRREPLPDVPVAVLVDGGTASASELVAAALQEEGRATLVGTRTFGKGSVLALQQVSGGGNVQYTTAFLFTPAGRPIEGHGVRPDVPVLPGGDGDPQLRRAVDVLGDG